MLRREGNQGQLAPSTGPPHNIQSLKPKIFELSTELSKFKYDLLTLKETWLRPSTPNRLLVVPGYQLLRADRPDGRGNDGVAVLMSVKLETYSYSFSASSYELHQNVYICRSHHAEHEHDIRFALGQTVWPLEVIKVSENRVPHRVFVYPPNRLKIHQTTCRGPRYRNTEQKPDWRILRSKVKVKYAKNPIFKHGVPHNSFVYLPKRLKMHQTTCRGHSYGNTTQ